MINLLQFFSAVPPAGQACNLPSSGFFKIPTWYEYLNGKYDVVIAKHADGSQYRPCTVDFTLLHAGKFSGDDMLAILLAIIDILIHFAALAAIGFVIYGGIKYITSQGSPEGTKEAQTTVINALIGLVVAIVAAAFVAFVGGQLA